MTGTPAPPRPRNRSEIDDAHKWDLADIYKGMLPFMALQWIAVLILYFFPQIILVLPNMMFGNK